MDCAFREGIGFRKCQEALRRRFEDIRRAELGRLEVELRVAPSRPLEFITVRLVHKGDRLSALEI